MRLRGLQKNLPALASLLVIFEAAVSAVRAVTLTRERAFDVDTFHHDPAFDIVANSVLGAASLLGAVVMLVTRRAWALYSTIAVLVVGGAEAGRLVAIDYGGTSYLNLLLVRGVVLILLSLQEVRAHYY